MRQIAVVGAGYVGLGTAAALATKGHRVVCVDSDPSRVDLVARGRAPFFEEGFDRVLTKLRKRELLRASLETAASVRNSDIVFLCVGTPSGADGSMDLSQLRAACMQVAEGLRENRGQLLVVKSTVTPGTTETVVVPTIEASSGLQVGQFRLCVNPEFLREGRVLQDSLRPSHIIVGEWDRASGRTLVRLYAPFGRPTFRTSIRVAETIKYAANAFLATKISFANELANICARLRLDADQVLQGMALDSRIGPEFLIPGAGFGGSCLPKDLRALLKLADSVGYDAPLLRSVYFLNSRQPSEVLRLLEEEIPTLVGRRVALLGLAFKAGTDDVRESKALDLLAALRQKGAEVIGYDPRGSENFRRVSKGIEIARSAEDALRGADACIIQASWPEFSRLGPKEFSVMASPIVIDARRTWPLAKIPKGIVYQRIG